MINLSCVLLPRLRALSMSSALAKTRAPWLAASGRNWLTTSAKVYSKIIFLSATHSILQWPVSSKDFCVKINNFTQLFCFFSACFLAVQSSAVQDGIYVLGKAHMCFTPSLRSFPNIASETVKHSIFQSQINTQNGSHNKDE